MVACRWPEPSGRMWCQMRGLRMTVRGVVASATVAGVVFAVAVAVGDGSAVGPSLAEAWDGSTWRMLKAPADGSIALSVVSCASASFCMGVFGDSDRIAEWNGQAWRLLSKPGSGCGSLTFCGLAEVSCPSARSCLAVGSLSNHNGTIVRSEALAWNGTTWRNTNPPSLGNSAGIFAVSCASTSSCIAIDGDGICDCVLTEGSDGSSWRQLHQRHRHPGNPGRAVERQHLASPGHAHSRRESQRPVRRVVPGHRPPRRGGVLRQQRGPPSDPRRGMERPNLARAGHALSRREGRRAVRPVVPERHQLRGGGHSRGQPQRPRREMGRQYVAGAGRAQSRRQRQRAERGLVHQQRPMLRGRRRPHAGLQHEASPGRSGQPRGCVRATAASWQPRRAPDRARAGRSAVTSARQATTSCLPRRGTAPAGGC